MNWNPKPTIWLIGDSGPVGPTPVLSVVYITRISTKQKISEGTCVCVFEAHLGHLDNRNDNVRKVPNTGKSYQNKGTVGMPLIVNGKDLTDLTICGHVDDLLGSFAPSLRLKSEAKVALWSELEKAETELARYYIHQLDQKYHEGTFSAMLKAAHKPHNKLAGTCFLNESLPDVTRDWLVVQARTLVTAYLPSLGASSTFVQIPPVPSPTLGSAAPESSHLEGRIP